MYIFYIHICTLYVLEFCILCICLHHVEKPIYIYHIYIDIVFFPCKYLLWKTLVLSGGARILFM